MWACLPGKWKRGPGEGEAEHRLSVGGWQLGSSVAGTQAGGEPRERLGPGGVLGVGEITIEGETGEWVANR